MKLDFIPIDYDYFDFEGRNYIRLVGRTNSGKKICVIDSYEPNFFMILKKGSEKKAESIAKKIKKVFVEKSGRRSEVERVEILKKTYLGIKVTALRVFITNHKDAHDIASEIGELKDVEFRREYDINIITKYIKEKGIEPLQWYRVEAESVSDLDFGGFADSIDLEACVRATSIKKLEKQEDFAPRVLAYDIETSDLDPNKGEISMISLYGRGYEKVFTHKDVSKKQSYVEVYKDEADMIQSFVKAVKEYDADIITGYFTDGFDLPFLKTRAEKYKIKLSLGMDSKGPSFSKGKISSGKFAGLVHVDLFRFIDAVFAQYLQSESLGLGDVAQELVGEGKEEFDFAKLSNMKESDWREFFSYNLQDARVTHKLFEKVLPDIIEFSKIVKEPLFSVTRDRMATHVENYLLHNLDLFDEIAEKRPLAEEIGRRRSLGAFEGAFVFEPEPGLYKDLVMFDFTSMYASVIVTYNLSKSTLLANDKFSKKEGFFPHMLGKIIEKRKVAKKEFAKKPSGMLRARSNAYKLLANASYGYQAYFGARYYCREAAAATAEFARKNIKSAIQKIRDEGHTIVYSDTDSIAFLRNGKTKQQIKEFLDVLNKGLPGIMELDLEDFYPRGIFVTKRSTTAGAKKKYALLDDSGEFKIRGFETVRRDWCMLARNLQSEVLRSILSTGDEKKALEIVKNTVRELKDRKVDHKDLIIRTQLRRSLTNYIAEGPHVVAAKKMKARGDKVFPGMAIRYFIGEGTGKGKRIGDNVYLPDEDAPYNINYYLNNQVLPAVENILEVFDIDVLDILDGQVQKKLF